MRMPPCTQSFLCRWFSPGETRGTFGDVCEVLEDALSRELFEVFHDELVEGSELAVFVEHEDLFVGEGVRRFGLPDGEDVDEVGVDSEVHHLVRFVDLHVVDALVQAVVLFEHEPPLVVSKRAEPGLRVDEVEVAFLVAQDLRVVDHQVLHVSHFEVLLREELVVWVMHVYCRSDIR